VIVGSILISDSIPFTLGKLFGPRLLRLRLMRTWMHQERLASFDNWFRDHGNKTILISRFLPGIRVPAFFTAGCMGVSYLRFGILNGLGALISSGVFILLGNQFSNRIDDVIEWVQRTERGLLIIVGIVGVGLLIWWLYKIHRRRKLLGDDDVHETFVEPSRHRDEIFVRPSVRRPFGPPLPSSWPSSFSAARKKNLQRSSGPFPRSGRSKARSRQRKVPPR
jgi:membrane protein DedA with SNARE-associated domain